MKKVFCNEDLSEERRVLRQEKREIVKFAVTNGFPDARVVGEKIVINGVTYQENELGLLPDKLKMENIRTRQIGSGIGFFSKHSYLSNFFLAKLVVNGQRFVHSEQAYQYIKALICGRDDIAKSIKSCTDPKKIKRYGDKADTKPEWEERKYDTMKCILTAKFVQNEQLREKLISTGTTLYWNVPQTYIGVLDGSLRTKVGAKKSNTQGKTTKYYYFNILLSEVRELPTVKGHSQELFGDLRGPHSNVLTGSDQTTKASIESSGLTPVVAAKGHKAKSLINERNGTAPKTIGSQNDPVNTVDNKPTSTQEKEEAGKRGQ